MNSNIQRLIEGFFHGQATQKNQQILNKNINLIPQFEVYLEMPPEINPDDVNSLYELITDGKYEYTVTNENIQWVVAKSIELFGGKIDLNWINTSNVTDMQQVFADQPYFNGNISKWDVSHVTNMYGMFENCEHFEGCDFSNWDVSNVIDMGNMFAGCYQFKGKGLGYWDVSNVTDMHQMFHGCGSLYEDLSNWNVQNCTNHSAAFEFCSARQPFFA